MDILRNQQGVDRKAEVQPDTEADQDSTLAVHSQPCHQEVRKFQVEACRPERDMVHSGHLALTIVDMVETEVDMLGVVAVAVAVVGPVLGEALLFLVEVVYLELICLELEVEIEVD